MATEPLVTAAKDDDSSYANEVVERRETEFTVDDNAKISSFLTGHETS